MEERKDNVIQLFTDGEVQTKDNRKFTRLIGGFGNDKPMFTIFQASELLGLGTDVIRKDFERNESNFKGNIDFIDLKSAKTLSLSENTVDITSFLKEVGYSQNKLNATKRWLAFSLSGMMKLVKIATTKESWDIYDNFLEDYFKTKAENVAMKETLNNELIFLNEQKANLIGKGVIEQDETKRLDYSMQLEKVNERIKNVEISLATEKLEKALENQSKLIHSKTEYVNQSDFGERFNRKIGAGTIGKLFQIVGLAKKTYHRTTPYEQYVPKYAVNVVDNDIEKKYDIAYKWNYENCTQFIDSWLKDTGRYDIFYSIVDKNEMLEYINELYDDIIINKQAV